MVLLPKTKTAKKKTFIKLDDEKKTFHSLQKKNHKYRYIVAFFFLKLLFDHNSNIYNSSNQNSLKIERPVLKSKIISYEKLETEAIKQS